MNTNGFQLMDRHFRPNNTARRFLDTIGLQPMELQFRPGNTAGVLWIPSDFSRWSFSFALMNLRIALTVRLKLKLHRLKHDGISKRAHRACSSPHGFGLKNNRLAVTSFHFSDGASREFRLPDQMKEQRIEVGKVRTDWVRIEMKQVYIAQGNSEYTAISKIRFEWEP